MKKNYWLILIILLINLSCKTFSKANKFDTLLLCVNSQEFLDHFGICENNNQEIKIYDSTEKFIDSKYINNCNKTVVLLKKDFEYDVNDLQVNRIDRGIIMYDYKKHPKKYSFSFLDTFTNSMLKLTFNNSNKIIKVEGGSF